MRKSLEAAFISIEGLDGSGKSTIVKYLAELMFIFGYNHQITREPGGSDVGELIRDVIIKNTMDATTEILLFNANRRNHVETLIKPNLKNGVNIITDRYVDSSMAYQAYANNTNIRPKDVVDMHNKFIHGYMPNWTLFLDVSVDESIERIAKRSAGLNSRDRFDDADRLFKERLYDGYKASLQSFDRSREVKIINASVALNVVKHQVYQWFTTVFCKKVNLPLAFLQDDSNYIESSIEARIKATQAEPDGITILSASDNSRHWKERLIGVPDGSEFGKYYSAIGNQPTE